MSLCFKRKPHTDARRASSSSHFAAPRARWTIVDSWAPPKLIDHIYSSEVAEYRCEDLRILGEYVLMYRKGGVDIYEIIYKDYQSLWPTSWFDRVRKHYANSLCLDDGDGGEFPGSSRRSKVYLWWNTEMTLRRTICLPNVLRKLWPRIFGVRLERKRTDTHIHNGKCVWPKCT